MARPTRLEIKQAADGPNLTLMVGGELDLSSVAVLAQHIDGCIGEHTTALTLNLSDLVFMDSSGLRFLIELNERADREGWGLSLVPSKHESANLVLRVTRADTALPFESQPGS